MTKRAGYGLVEPYLLFLVFAGIALGTILLEQHVRLAVLWSVLGLVCLVYAGCGEFSLDFSLPAVGRGALLGAVISVPALALLSDTLRTFSERLYGTTDVVWLLYQVCFVSAPIEEGFFRGIVQTRRGSSMAIAFYALTAWLYFLGNAPILAVLIVFVAFGVLGILYSYVRDRYGLSAAIASHVTAGLLLQVVPSLIGTLRSLVS